MILNISFNKKNIKDHVSNILYEIKGKIINIKLCKKDYKKIK